MASSSAARHNRIDAKLTTVAISELNLDVTKKTTKKKEQPAAVAKARLRSVHD